MTQFRKKPVIIEARQLRGFNAVELAVWCDGVLMDDLEEGGYFIGLATFEGEMKAKLGDWIIKEPFETADRRFYPCKPDIFDKTYEAV